MAESLDSRGLYVFDDGLRFVIWIGRMLPPEVARALNLDFASDLSQVRPLTFISDIASKLFCVSQSGDLILICGGPSKLFPNTFHFHIFPTASTLSESLHNCIPTTL